jgi:uncharacterized protein involved in exopolysaccharide biosynthesis
VLSPYLSDRSLTQNLLPGIAHPVGDAFSDSGIGLWECWTTIRTHSRLVFAFVGAALSLTVLVVLVATRNYTSYVILRIDPEAPRILDMTQLLDQIQNTEEHDYYKTEYELLSSEE